MFRRKVVFGLAACLVAMLLVSQSFSAGGARGGRAAGGRRGPQDGQAAGGGRGAQGGQRPGGAEAPRDFQQMRERMQQMMDERMKEQLGIADDAEWKVFKPRLQKVQDLNRQLNAGGRMSMFGGRGGFGQRGGPGGRGPGGRGQDRGPDARPGAPERELGAVEKAAQQLQELLSSEAPKAADIKAKLTAYRAAKEQVKAELAKAQAELKLILSVKQEASLVLMGLMP